MSELRLKLIELAIQGGATIENATKVATAWEQWATEDDPLRLDAPSPVIDERQICASATLGDNGKYTMSQRQEIDWSRPQLVNNGHGLVLRTTGYHGDKAVTHGDPWFEGEVVNMKWNHFEAGDIGTDWRKAEFIYDGEIPQEHPTEEKATGLSFIEAISTCGESLFSRPGDATYGFDKHGDLRMKTNGSAMHERHFWSFPVLSRKDFLATDWQIATP